jgi:predicted enzyme related to lactoylglutathione lyase
MQDKQGRGSRMKYPVFAAVKLQTCDLAACERFFRGVFGFEVTHRYGGNDGDTFAEIVMALPGKHALLLKFVQPSDGSANATGAMIQIRLEDVEAALKMSIAAGASVLMRPTCFVEAGVRMAVIRTDQGVDVELVQPL